MEQTLKVVITGDVKGLDDAAIQAQKTMESLNAKIKATSKDIASNIQISQGYERAINELNKELSEGVISQAQYQKALTRLQRDEKETTVETSRLRKELSNLKRQQKELARATPTLTNGISATGKATANATPTLIEFGRVIQDAPFGIQGVANNIQQLVTNFGYLKQSAGSSKAAFQGLISSLTGPAGMVIAVSVITSLLVSYGDKIFSSKSKTEKLAEAAEKAAEKMDKFIDSLNDVDKANLEANKSATAQIIKLTALRSQIENTTNSTDLRLDGIKRLRSEFGGYFKNISDEALLNGTAASSYDVLTNSILKRAKATAATNILVKNAEKEFDINEKIKKNNEDIVALGKERVMLQSQVNTTERTGADLDAAEKLENNQKINALIEEQVELSKQLGSILGSNKELETIVKANEVIIPDFNSLFKQEKQENKKTAEQIAKEKKRIFDKIDADIIEQEDKDRENFIKKWENVQIEIDPFDGDFIKIEESFSQTLKVEDKIKELQKTLSKLKIEDINLEGLSLSQLEDFEKRLNTSIQVSTLFSEAVGSSFQALGNQLAQTFETGNAALDAFTGSIIKSLTDILAAQLTALITKQAYAAGNIAVDTAVATSSGISAASQTAAASGPLGAFLLPVLIAGAVAAIGAAFSGIGKFATGGIVGGGSYVGDKNLALVNSGEMILNTRQQSNLFDLLNSKVSNSSGNSGKLVAETRLRNGDIYLAFKQAERRNRRL